MRLCETLWHKDFNVFANEFVTRQAEQFFDVRIYQRDMPLMIDKDCAARRSLCRQMKKLLRRSQHISRSPRVEC